MYFMNIVKELSIQSRLLTLLNQNKLVVNLISGNFEPMGIKLRNIKLKVSLINVLIKVKWCRFHEVMYKYRLSKSDSLHVLSLAVSIVFIVNIITVLFVACNENTVKNTVRIPSLSLVFSYCQSC